MYDFIEATFWRHFGDYKYVILDPFNHTYTPSKNIRISNEYGTKMTKCLYPRVFEEALNYVLINNKMNI